MKSPYYMNTLASIDAETQFSINLSSPRRFSIPENVIILKRLWATGEYNAPILAEMFETTKPSIYNQLYKLGLKEKKSK